VVKYFFKVAIVFKQQKEKSVTKDKLIGMKVISGDGKLVGTVKDVGFTVGKAGISLSVEDIDGETQDVSWESIQGAVDFVVLKLITPSAEPVVQIVQQPQTIQQVQPIQTAQPLQNAQPMQQNQSLCPKCSGPLTYIPQYQRWYCYKCQKYA
jgi:sporulation protein YlmC with PRC-barrel domain